MIDNHDEIWKDLGFLGFSRYAVSDFGRVKRLDKNLILKQSFTRSGYLQVDLFTDEHKVKHCRTNRLCAMAFLLDQRKHDDDTVHHIDEDKNNNAKSNLMWLPHKDNCRQSIKGRRVNQYTLEGEYVQSYDFLIDAARQMAVSSSCIRYHCNNGKALQGYFFEYETDNNTINNNKDGYNE